MASRPTVRLAQSFSATASKHPVRRLHITGVQNNSQSLFESVVAELPRRKEGSTAPRHFNTSRELKATNDSSTIDFAYMPDIFTLRPSLAERTAITHIPLLPSTESSPLASDTTFEPVAKPQIHTISAQEGTVVSAMSDVLDNGSMAKGVDFGGLLEKMEDVKGKVEQEKGVVREVLEGLVDDLLGKKAVKL